MSGGPTPDPERLAAARGVARGYFERKKMWLRVLFFVAGVCELGFFGAMLYFFDFSDRFYWFLFFGLTFVYSPLIMFVMRNSVMIDRMYYRLLWELKYEGTPHRESDADRAEVPSFEDGAEERERGEVRGFLASKQRWAKMMFIVACVFETMFFVLMLYFMDYSSQLHWFLFSGFVGVYTPLIVSTWRNIFAIDRAYYGLIDELKYGGR